MTAIMVPVGGTPTRVIQLPANRRARSAPAPSSRGAGPGEPGAKNCFKVFHFVSFPIWAPWALGAVWGACEIGTDGVRGAFGRDCYRGPGAAGCGGAGRRRERQGDHGGMIAQKFFGGKDCLNCDSWD